MVTLPKIQFWSLILESETSRSFKMCSNSDCVCTLQFFDTKLTVKLCFPALFIHWITLVVQYTSHETPAKVVLNGKCYINMATKFEHYAVTSCSSRAPLLLPTTPSGSGLACNMYKHVSLGRSFVFSHHRKKDVSSVSGCSCALAVSDSAYTVHKYRDNHFIYGCFCNV
jgi:hypothetical protein